MRMPVDSEVTRNLPLVLSELKRGVVLRLLLVSPSHVSGPVYANFPDYDLFYSRNQAVHIVSLPLFFCNLSII
jgi:hypothetical protein